MSPRTGRPKSDNPKDVRIGVRLDSETIRKLDEVAAIKMENRSQVIRRGIELVYKDAKK